MKVAALTMLLFWIISSAASAHRVPASFEHYMRTQHPCLASIIDVEDPSWDPTVSWHDHHNVNDSYGLGQANPGTKMSSYGSDWRTNPWTQLKWMRVYVLRYGGECGAAYYRSHHKSY